MILFSWNWSSVRTKGTNFKPKLGKICGFWGDKCFIKVWDLTEICSWLKFLLGTPWHYLDMTVWSWYIFDGKIRHKKMDFNNIFENQIFSLHICLCTPKSIAFFEMWLFNANLNCTCTQNLLECPTFSHCALLHLVAKIRHLILNFCCPTPNFCAVIFQTFAGLFGTQKLCANYPVFKQF